MKYKAIVFDLDQTLIDSSALENLRTSRQWGKVMQNLHLVSQIAEIKNLLQSLKNQGIKIGIITNSPRMYAEGVLRHIDIPYDSLIAFHDVVYRKPHPEAFNKMLMKLNVVCQDCLSVGDHDNDIVASQRANIQAIGVTWYSSTYSFTSTPHLIVQNVEGLITHLNKP